MANKIKEIVLTGGPCSGKTTALAFIQEWLSNHGWRVFLVPETATMFITGGIHDISKIAENDFNKYLEIEKRMLLYQMRQREEFLTLAGLFKNEKCVIIYDRAEGDIPAYLPKTYFDVMVEDMGISWDKIKINYDGVIHLVTAANGAEEFYTTANNKARRENIKEAVAADIKTQAAWSGTPKLRIIDNSTGFEIKLKRVLQAITGFLGIPVPLEIERKFLLRCTPDFSNEHLKDAEEILLEQMYLVSPNPGEEIRIRKRSVKNSNIYYRTHKIKIRSKVRQEKEEKISAKEYLDLSTLKDPETLIIYKSRYCFIYKNQYFELDIFKNPPDLCLLEIELTDENDKVEMPPFLDVIKEVTEDEEYSNRGLAKQLPPKNQNKSPRN